MAETQKMYLGVTEVSTTYFGDTGAVVGYKNLDDAVVEFVAATGITDLTIIDSLQTLVVSLKNNNIWDKLLAIYPFVGGTSTTNKYNLKDARDLDAAYRIDFQSNFSFASTGVTGNGLGSARTFLNPSIDLSQNSFSVVMYSRTNSDNTSYDFGATNGTSGISAQSRNGGRMYVRGATSIEIDGASSSSAGLFYVRRTASSSFQFKPANFSLGGEFNGTITSTTLPNEEMYFGGLSGSNYSTREYAWLSIGDGLTSTEAINLGNAVITFQTDLSRNV